MSYIKNKIHIYSVDNFELKHCFGETIQMERLMNVAFSKKNRFLGFLFDDLTVNIYSLIVDVEPKKGTVCKCKKDDAKKSVFEGILSGIKVFKLIIT